jgi:DNA-binding HxlR family transcriptional regulator
VAATVRMTGPLDPRGGWEATDCSLAATLDLLSTRSSFLLLREAFYGATRFEEFATRVGISEPVAAARLRQMVQHGLLEREDYQEPGQRTRQGYVLTQKGAELLPALAALMEWGDRWLAPGDVAVELRHRDCDHAVHVALRCTDEHDVPLDQLDLAARRRARS